MLMISLVINLDSRPGIDGCEGGSMGDGSRSWDFFIHGIRNKQAFVNSYTVDFETVVFIDRHLPIPRDILEWMDGNVTRYVISKHSRKYRENDSCHWFNDINYLNGLSLARGEFLAHFDADTFAAGDFRKWAESVDNGKLHDFNRFVSYPCASSPDPNPDRARWQHFRWVSTRAFFCHRDSLRLEELELCLRDNDYAWKTYGDPDGGRHPWLEHFIGLMNEPHKIYYPPLNDDFMIWSWSKYIAGVLPALNKMALPEVRQYAQRCGGVSWSGELEAKPV